MAVPTTAEFLSKFPEFGEQTGTVVEGAIAEAARFTPETVWGDLQSDAISYLAAHELALRTMQMGMMVGALSGSPLGEGYKATLYGARYEQMLRSLPLTGFAF
jgi:hypothetical protein